MAQRLSASASTLHEAMRQAWTVLKVAWRTVMAAPNRPYRPEAHYMRGPGPKTREKQARGADASGSSTPDRSSARRMRARD